MNTHSFTLFHRFIFLLMRVFYDQIEIDGREKVPDGKVIFVANHPNGLLDPIILMMMVNYKVRFLAMSKLFAMPVISWACRKFDALPIFRASDTGFKGGPNGAEDAAQRNEGTFADARRYLTAGGAIALFPEGTTHSDPSLLPLKTGAARLALGTELDNDWQANLTIVPIGLWYERKRKFRSSVFVKVGRPFILYNYRESYEANDRQAVRDLTERIKTEMDTVVLQAEEIDILRVAPFISDWIAPPEATDELHEVHSWTSRLLKTYETLREKDPERLNTLVDALQEYGNALRLFGITDPWSLETKHKRGAMIRAAVWLVLSAPFALVGAVIGYLPYKGAQLLAKSVMADDRTQTSLVKSLGGLVFFMLLWLTLIILSGLNFSWIGALLALFLTPALAALAIAWIEVNNSFRTLRYHQKLRRNKGEAVDLLVAQREDIAAQVLSAVKWVEKQPRS